MSKFYDNDPNFNNLWTKAADDGNGQFAIAVAMLEVAKSGNSIASALRWLGTGDAATPMGAIEFLSANLGEKLAGLESIAGAVDRIAEAIDCNTPNVPARENGEGDRR